MIATCSRCEKEFNPDKEGAIGIPVEYGDEDDYCEGCWQRYLIEP